MIRRTIFALFIALAAFGPAAPALDFSEVETRHFRIRFGERLAAREVNETTDAFESAYAKLETALGIAAPRPIDVVIFAQTGDFTATTGLPWWSASAMSDGAIYLQPVRVLARRGVLETTISHEVCLALLFIRHGRDMPPWLAEGLAVYHAGEIEKIRQGLSSDRPPVGGSDDIDALLSDRNDPVRNRWGYVLAYEAVRALVEGAPAAHTRKGGQR